MNDSNSNLEKEFFEYLDAKFGKNFSSTIQKPDGYCIGERVLYKLHQPAEVTRKSHESKDKYKKHNKVSFASKF